MRNVSVFLLTLLLGLNSLFARKIVVDPYGAINTVQVGINLAADGDTVKVLPGTYEEQIVLNKNIILMGSGYENTSLTGSFDPVLEIKAGVVQWFLISSLSGNGVKISGGTLRNCVVNGSAKNGVYSNSGEGHVQNCVLVNNGYNGIYVEDQGYVYAVNCIAWGNKNYDFNSHYRKVNVSYSIAKSTIDITNGQGVIYEDPQFTSEDDYHIGTESPGWDAGNPSLKDPDGSRSDMGYFGGPNCPIYPVVTSIKLIPQENGSVRIEATGRANY